MISKMRIRKGRRKRLEENGVGVKRLAKAGKHSPLPGLLEDTDPDLPPLPQADERGLFPAVATARVIIARQIIRGRKLAGWTQAELAARVGVRQETISRIETGKHSPGVKTMAKIDRALKKAGV
jgi:DNA-binding XRE family transcriptional regulator